ncbi:MAG: carbohydrate kinase family protein [Planctomycetes bacterium]|nr:carbohydrate kinase family protein [Planctomycetota bacterium]MCB9890741.1 carbohydrate kinase family protein [Planctomycetota bacterium]
MTSILCIGNAGIDLIAPVGTAWPTRAGAWQVVEGGLEVKAGGCGHDTAIGIAKLGVSSKLIAGVGRGGHGKFVRDELERHGVDLPARCTHPTRTTPLELLVADDGGRPSALHFVGASNHVDAKLLRELHGEGFFDDCSAIHLGGVGLLPGLERQDFAQALLDILAHASCLELSLDVSLHERRSRDVWHRVLQPLLGTGCVTVFSPNYDEACQIHGLPRDATIPARWAKDFFDFLRSHYEGLAKDFVLIVRDGGQGSVAVDASGQEVRLRAEPVEPVDLTSAGEAWWAGFLVGRHRQRERREFDRSAGALVPALRFAHSVAARAVQVRGSSAWDFSDLVEA